MQVRVVHPLHHVYTRVGIRVVLQPNNKKHKTKLFFSLPLGFEPTAPGN